ncbi:MAG TPA: hypothetical protein PL105_01070 [Caldilineaceae bacterium]|nr:hypothetical protein [Caldilineaceae bacterium]
MAVAGGATSAYWCSVMDDVLYCSPTTTLRSQCVPVAQAVERMGRGERVMVAGSDVAALRSEVEKVLGQGQTAPTPTGGSAQAH